MGIDKEKIIEYFRDKKGVIAVYLYGSIVTGMFVMNSDVDIALLKFQANQMS